jgi:hypothetical protein
MSAITVGRRVEFTSYNDRDRVFRGELLRTLADGYYGLVRDRSGLSPRLVRMDRLRMPEWPAAQKMRT